MKLYALLFLSLSAHFLYSCSNDDSQSNNTEENSFYALRVGNYWKYQWNRTDADGNPIEEWATEEILVEDETTINGESFFKLKITTTDENGDCLLCQEEPLVYQFVRDSLGYLINSDHQILFSSQDSNPILQSENSWGNIYFQLQENASSVEVPAGTFSCIGNQVYAINPDGAEFPGRDERWYAPEIGWIKITCSGVSTDIQIAEKVLADYEFPLE